VVGGLWNRGIPGGTTIVGGVGGEFQAYPAEDVDGAESIRKDRHAFDGWYGVASSYEKRRHHADNDATDSDLAGPLLFFLLFGFFLLASGKIHFGYVRLTFPDCAH
jgi:hypothetical protein